MRHFSSLLICATLVAGCKPVGESPAPPAGTPAAATPLTADTASTTAAGNTFAAPKDWTLTTQGPATILTAPESDARIALIDVPATDADAAVAAAWQAYDKDATWPLKLATDRPGRDGWDAIRSYRFDASK